MLRNLVHICIALMVGLTAPTASVVRLSCADSGATTLTMCTLDTDCASDPCCPGDSGAASLRAGCCRTDVFSLTSTSPVPTAPAMHAIPVFICNIPPEATADPTSRVEMTVPDLPPGRNLPLLV
jgi:hypothetical protein